MTIHVCEICGKKKGSIYAILKHVNDKHLPNLSAGSIHGKRCWCGAGLACANDFYKHMIQDHQSRDHVSVMHQSLLGIQP